MDASSPNPEKKNTSLRAVLGEETILSTVTPFIYYLDTAVAVYDSGGEQIGRVIAGSEYCRFLNSAVPHKCAEYGRKITSRAITERRQEISNCCGGLVLGASPVVVDDDVLGAVVGAVSEPVSDEDALQEIARCCGVELDQLRRAAANSFHKPDYIYDAALKHLDVLAQLLGRLYKSALEKETALSQAIDKEVDLAAARELDERIFTSMSAGLAVLDGDMTVRVWNDAAARITGVEANRAVGENLGDVIPGAMRNGFEKIVREVIHTGEPWRNSDAAGGIHVHDKPPFLDITIRPLCRKEDTGSGVVVLFDDITEEVATENKLKQRMLEMEALNKVISAASTSLDPDVLYSHTSKALQEVTGARLAAIYTLDSGMGVFRLAGSSYQPEKEYREYVESLSLSDSLERLLAESGKAVVVHDIESDSLVTPERKRIALEQGFSSLVAMPVKSRDEVMGMLMVFSDEADICSEEKIRFIDLLSDQLGIAMRNSRLFSEVEDSNRFLKNLLKSMDEGVYTCDTDNRVTFINDAAERISGFSAGELLGKNILDLVPQDQMPKVQEMRARREAGETNRYELDVMTKDGRRITLSQSVSELIQDGAEAGIVGVVGDISRRKHLSERLQVQNQRLQLLQSVMAKSVSGLTRGKALKTLVHEVADTFGYCLCNIFMPNADGGKLQIVASHGYDLQYVTRLNESDSFSLTDPSFTKTPVVDAFVNGKQGAISDIESDSPDPRLTDSARKYGFRSACSTPLEYKGEKLGVLVVYTEEPHGFDEEELGLLASIAAQASTIVGTADVYDRLIRSEERYRELYNSAADWMYSVDANGILLDCNDTMVKELGVPKDDLIGRPIYQYHGEEDRKKAQEIFSTRSHEGETAYGERTFILDDDRYITVEFHARFVYEETGNSPQWHVIARDITEKKEAEKRINLLAAAVENTRESVIISDLNGDIISTNSATAKILGFDNPEELAGRHMGEVYADENPDALKEDIYQKTLNGGWHGQLLFKRRNGSTFPAFVSSSAVCDSHGKPIAMVGISRDITAERRMTEEILTRNRELAVLNAVAAAASTSLDLESILSLCMESVVESGGYDAGIIYLVNEEKAELNPRAWKGIPEELLALVRNIRIGEGFAGNIAGTGAPIFADDNENSPYRMDRTSRNKPWFASVGGVPLISRERLLGVMMVGTRLEHEFNEREQELLVSAGTTVGVAIDNARLFRDVARAKKEWETTFDAMTNGVSIHGLDFTVVRANQALARMLGMEAADLVGKKCYEVFHGMDGVISDCPHVKAVETGQSVNIVAEEPFLGRTLHISADPIFDSEGNVIGTVHDVRDITEQETLREQLNQSEKIRALGEMAGGVAHDFNNFLTVILGNCQLLLGQVEERELKESLESIQHAAADASETVRRIQEFTRVRTTRSFTTVDINEVIRNSMEVTRPRWQNEADARGVTIDINLELGNIPPVNGNGSELSEVIINMILNALDALEGGGRIAISSKASGDVVEVSVKDDGEGMPEVVRRRVFEPFFSTKGPQGTGLGLSVAFGIINRHGGDIMVQSMKGHGTTFTIRLPQAAFSDLQEAREPEEMPSEVRTAKVLVVDDAAMIRTLLEDILEDMGHIAVSTESGREALKLFEAANAGSGDDAGNGGGSGGEKPFDVVLTDLGMPGMSGWDVVEQVKDISPGTPVVLITGWGDQLDHEKMARSRVDEVLAKPFKVADVRRLLAKALAGK